MRIGVIYGGKSAEHDISLRSVLNVFNQIEAIGYKAILIGISKSGKAYLQNSDKVKENVDIISFENSVFFSPGNGIIDSFGNNLKINCVFPLIHGAYGEDGCLQGMLEMCDIPYIGENVATSAVCMDKYLTKIILQQSNIKITPFLLVEKKQTFLDYGFYSKVLGKKIVVKPVSSGSSFGVSFINSEEGFHAALLSAGEFSDRILIEKYIEGREINCALLGTPTLIGELGEIIGIESPIYSYDEKYKLNSNKLQIPAQFSTAVEERIKFVALQSFRALNCKSMARIDMFLANDGVIYVNEVNTIPAFNQKSIYPQLLESIGISSSNLLLQLINQSIKKQFIL